MCNIAESSVSIESPWIDKDEESVENWEKSQHGSSPLESFIFV